MNTARIVVLVIALGAGGVAAYLASGYDNKPAPQTQIAGSIARVPLMQGEPIREQKLVRAEGSGFMAAILPSGMRAVSTEISAETGAGGFILPNDRVDIVLTRRLKNPDGGNTNG